MRRPLPQVTDPIRKPVGKPLADLCRKPRPNGGPNGIPLLGRKRGKLIRKPVREPVPQFLREPLSDDAADGGALLRRKRGKPVSLPARISPEGCGSPFPSNH